MNTGGTNEHRVTVALPAVRFQSACFTYFIRGSDGIKIGRSFSPRKRKIELQPGSASELTLLLAVPFSIITESAAHERFDHLKIRGEWFRPEQELYDFIGELKDQIKPHPGDRIRKGSPEIEVIVKGLLWHRRSANQTKKHLLHGMIQMLRNYSDAKDDPPRKAHIAWRIAQTASAIEQAQ